jgi:hypothetical protein
VTHTYDPTTDIGRIRREIIREQSSTTALLTDEVIQSYLTDNDDDWRLAAAEVLDFYANNYIDRLQVMSDSGFSINGASMAAAMHNQANNLREKAAAAGDDNSGFDIAETDWETLI